MLTFFTGVTCLFAAVGVVGDAMVLERSNSLSLLFAVVANGVGAALWAAFFTLRKLNGLIAMAIYQFTLFPYLTDLVRSKPRVLTIEQVKQGWIEHSAIVIFCIITGYILFIVFFRSEGKRYFAAHAEIQLASAIQRELVPALSFAAGGFEFYGVSLPSGTVGGDLLDVVRAENSFCAYVADVAGHGVPAGVLMSMVKSAVRMRMASLGPCDTGLLDALNGVLQPLTSPSTYATFAYLACNGDSRLQFSTAGHLPILHYDHARRVVDRCSVENFPIAMFPTASFATGAIECKPGDVLAMITDGVTEVFDREGRELGCEHVENALTESAGEPLAEIAERVLRRTEEFGAINDDRTMLLVRRVGG